ncbi:MAG: DUF956 family protein [Firmicutes bacterium]|nr:DUF956 family protein [Bacillota bacterium]
MIQSLNKTVDLVDKGQFLTGIPTYGKIMIGDGGFEYYNDKNIADFIQIPWNQVDHVAASVLFNKSISRFAIFTKQNGAFTFSTRDNKKTLRMVNKYIDSNNLVRSLSFFDVIKLGLKGLLNRIFKR